MKSTCLLLLVFITSNITAQKIELYGGPNYNSFYNLEKNTPHTTASYTPGYGYTAGIAIDEIKIDWLKMCFTAQIDNYQGELRYQIGGLGGSQTTDAKTERQYYQSDYFHSTSNF